jgi:CheY-like chemotaxis protein
MGGTVGMSSRSGEGSRFWFRVPVGIVVASVPAMPTGVAAAAERGALFAGRVLVADDTPANRLVTERLLARLGVTVAAVEDGQGALDGATGPLRPDLVFMDLQMPDMDGLEATRRIRAWEALGGAPRIPVVALTAAAFDTDRQRCMDAGMDGYIAKPVMLANLRAELARWLPRRIPPAEPAAAAALSSPAAGRG